MTTPPIVPPTVYCTTGDLLLGDIPTPAYVDKALYVSNAAEEIDSALAVRYVTPIILDDLDVTHRPARLILKRINAHIATGRIIMAASAGAEDGSVHAYGRYLLREASNALAALAAGNPTLEGAVEKESDFTDLSDKPVILNGDDISGVDEFYGMTSPGGMLNLGR